MKIIQNIYMKISLLMKCADEADFQRFPSITQESWFAKEKNYKKEKRKFMQY